MENNQTMNLSAAEIEMIELRRKEDALKLEKAIAQKKIDDEKKVDQMKMQIIVESRENEEMVQAIRGFYDELQTNHPGLYRLDTRTYNKHFEAKNSYYRKESVPVGVTVNENNEEILSSNDIPLIDAKIIRVEDENYYITVEMTVKKSSMHSRTMIPDCYKMKINGLGDGYWNKFFKVTSTVHTKIQDKINQINRNNELADLQKHGWEQLYNELKAEFPEAKIEKYAKSEGIYSYRNGRRTMTSVREIKQVFVTFPNTAKITYEFRNADKFEKIITNVERGSIDMTKLANALRGL